MELFRYLGDQVDRPKYLIGDYDDSPGYEVEFPIFKIY